ncbi:MAG TPA: hypothetical protein DGG95_04390 [Cytophagales bacterium]|jgi:outer membrane protein assembly factor BamB|nr:hypothetical protein [Cytophagales bacterium]
MKKLALLFFLCVHFTGYGQEFPVAWKSKFSFNPDRTFFSGDGKFVAARDESQAEMLDGETGKTIWKINFNKDLKIKSLARAVFNQGAGIVLFFNKDGKKESGDKVIVDFNTGKELWRTKGFAGVDNDDQYHFAHCMNLVYKGMTIVFDDATKKFTGIDVITGNKKWESNAYPDLDLNKNISIDEIEGTEYAKIQIAFEDDETKNRDEYMSILTGQTIVPTKIKETGSGSTIKGANRVYITKVVDNNRIRLIGAMRMLSPTKIKYDLKVSGDYNWSKQFSGSAVRQLFNNEPYVKMDVQGDKIFVLAKQIMVFDLKTGEQLWQEAYDNCDASAGLRAKQEFGIAGWPLLDGDFVYYVDLVGRNAIKKVEAKTGKVVWQTEPIKSNDRVPNLNIINGVLIAQFGGMINTQIYIPGMNGVPDRYKNENRFDGDYGVRAYDLNTGATIWDTHNLAGKLGDKFSDRISTIYGVGNKLVVASDKNLFCLDAKTGDIVYKTPLNESKIGDTFAMLVSDDNRSLYILCDGGIASADIATGKLNYATKTGDILWKVPGEDTYSFWYGSNYFLLIGEKNFIGFDLATGKVKGKMKWKVKPLFTTDGNYIFDRDDEKVTKYAVNK